MSDRSRVLIGRLLWFMLISAVLPVRTPGGQESAHSATLGWDLTYMEVLQSNKLEPADVLWLTATDRYRSPVAEALKGWTGAPITGSVLYEFPAGHGRAHGVLWLIRTSDHAYYRLLFVDAPFRGKQGEIAPALFDSILGSACKWDQAERPKHPPDVVLAIDYWGFLSTYDGTNSRQLVLTIDDFITIPVQGTEGRHGRASKLFDSILKDVPWEEESP